MDSERVATHKAVSTLLRYAERRFAGLCRVERTFTQNPASLGGLRVGSSCMPRLLAVFELQVAVLQWRDLARFARFGQSRQWFDASLYAPDGVEQATARFLVFHHGFSPEAWEQIAAYAQANPDLEAAPVVFTSDVPEYAASSVAMQWRLLFAFGAQFTMYAGAEAATYLCERHKLTGEQWAMSYAFLQAQEDWWSI